MIKASEKASKILIRDFGEIEKLQVSKKSPSDFVTKSDLKVEKIETSPQPSQIPLRHLVKSLSK